LNLRAYPEKWECLDHLTTAYIIQALRGLSVFTSAAQAHTVEDLLTDLGVLSTYRGPLGRGLDRLGGKGLVERRGGSYFANPTLPPPDVSTHRDIAAQVLADIPFFLSYMERCGEMLIAVLTGKESPLETLFPGGSPDTAEHIYQHWALSRYFNETVAAVTAATVAGIPRDPGGEPIRIIEIGAGTGSTTRSVLPLLPHTQIQYVFTDISEVFFHQAERKFNDYPFLRYASLNIEQAPEAQGFGVGQFDIAIAANVLHATGDLRRTLQNVRSLLSPGGLLVLYEVTSPHSWFDITVALVEGWQRFSDDLRTDGPLLSADQWSDLLRS
jgi:epothilone polyketide synthase E